MNSERDELLDNLINYYDSPEDETLGGDTTVIPVQDITAASEEVLGDTLIMNVAPQSTPTPQEETTVINVSEQNFPDVPQDEVFGNLDINGNVIPRRPREIPRRPTQAQQPRQSLIHEAPPTRKTGIWYTFKPLWATFIVSIMLVLSFMFYITDTGIIGIYKSNFTYNFSLILRVFGIEYDFTRELPVVGENDSFTTTALADGEGVTYDTISDKKVSVPFTGADIASFEKYDGGVVCAKSNYLCFINKSGKKKWEFETQISNPILATSGNYIALAGKGSTYLDLYKGDKQVFSIKVADKIKACSVSEKGDVALVTDKTAYKGGVSVYNKKGEEVFSWISGVNYITSVSTLKSRNVAVSLVSTENNIKSYVMLFDIYSTDPINGTEITDSLVFDSVPYVNNVYACADNSIISVNKDGELNYSVRFDNMNITHTASDTKGWRAVSYTEGYLPYINIYNKNGSLYASSETESVPDYLDIYKSTVLYNNGRDVICGEIDDVKARYSAPMTVKGLIMMSRNTYMIVYENSLEIIKL